jgi:predicted nicotinamide N-methyase
MMFLTKQFLQGRDINNLDISLTDLTPETQERFINQISHQQLKPDASYSRKFLKKYAQHIESHGHEASESLVLMMADLMITKERDEDNYRVYSIKDTAIVLRESNRLIVNGTTGLRTWEAALYFTEWLSCKGDIFSGKRVLEFGSGLGLVGIAMASIANAARVSLTDTHELVIDALKQNLELNNHVCHCKVSVTPFDWESQDVAMLQVEEIDFIVATDCFYEERVITGFINTIKRAVSLNSNIICYLAITKRNDLTWNYFSDELKHSGLTYTLIEPNLPQELHLIHDYDVSRVHILKISK